MYVLQSQEGLGLRRFWITNRCAQFLQRSRVLSLYRTIIRATRRIQDPTTRAETRKFARDEFERHRQVTDLVRGIISRMPFQDYEHALLYQLRPRS